MWPVFTKLRRGHVSAWRYAHSSCFGLEVTSPVTSFHWSPSISTILFVSRYVTRTRIGNNRILFATSGSNAGIPLCVININSLILTFKSDYWSRHWFWVFTTHALNASLKLSNFLRKSLKKRVVSAFPMGFWWSLDGASTCKVGVVYVGYYVTLTIWPVT